MPASEPLLAEKLSPREREFLRLLAEDSSNAQIAERLVLSSGTVRWYVKQIYAKLGVHSREEAVEKANSVLQAPTLPPHNLPVPPTPFVGRERELAELARLLSDPDVRLVTILSPGGMGKTRLALALAEQQLYAFPDGVFFLPLYALGAPDHLLTAIAEAVNYRFEESPHPLLHQLQGFLRAKTLLLVLDNFEHLLDSAPLVSELLSAAPALHCLITSRERLNLHGEVAYVLAGLDFPTEGELQKTFSAVELFLQSAQYARPGFSPHNEDVEAIADICRLVEGMPLALELAASWADLLTPAEIAREIRGDLDFLASDARDSPERQHSMRAVFNAVWNRLTDAERTAFMRLSVFRGGCTHDAAHAVTSASLRTLAGLVDKALLRVDGSGRYQVHELLRQFALAQLEAAQAAETVHAAHSAYYLDLLRRKEPHIKGARFFEAQAELSAELGNLLAACLSAISSVDLEPLAAGITALGAFFHTWDGHWLTGSAFLGELAASLRMRTPSPVRDGLLAEVLAWQVFVVMYLGQTQTAEALLREGADLAERVNTIRVRIIVDLARAALRLDTLQDLTGAMNTYREPVAYLEHALKLLDSHHDPFLKADALRRLGWICLRSDRDLDIARERLEHALQSAQQTENPYLISWALMIRASVIGFADYPRGKQAFRECVAYCKQTGQRLRLASTLNGLGVIYAVHSVAREADRALSCYRAALSIYEALGHMYGKRSVYANMSAYMWWRGEFVLAREYSGERLSLLEMGEDHESMADTLEALAWINVLEGWYEEAEAWISRALELVRGQPHIRLEVAVDVHYTAAAIALRQKHSDDADAHREVGLALARTLEQPWRVVRGVGLQGVLAYARGDVSGARACLRDALGSSLTTNVPPVQRLNQQMYSVWAYDLLSQIEREQGNRAVSRALATEVLQIGQRLLSDGILLMGLLQIAHHVARLQAVELASLVQAHRHSYGFSREQAALLLDKLRGELTAEAFAAAVERGKSLDVAHTAQEALIWLETQPTQDA